MRKFFVFANQHGDCGHKHRTISGACRCEDRHHKGCKMQGGYSDRGLYRVDDEGVYYCVECGRQIAPRGLPPDDAYCKKCIKKARDEEDKDYRLQMQGYEYPF